MIDCIILKKNLIIFFISLILLTKFTAVSSISNELKSNIDLIPINPDLTILETNYSKQDNLDNDFNMLNIGIQNLLWNNYNLDISYNNNSYPASYYLENINQSSITTRISFFSDYSLYRFPDWKYYSSFSYGKNFLNNTSCYEGNSIIIKKNNAVCSSSGKTIYQTSNSPVKINGNVISLELGIRKKNLNWENKTIIDIGLNTNQIDYRTTFDNIFDNISESLYRYDFPQDDIWFSNNIYLGFKKSKKINEKWGIGGGVTFINNWVKNYINGKNSIKSRNIKLEGKLTRNFENQYYFSLGGFYASNYLLGIRPGEIRRGNENFFNKDYGELKISAGLIFDSALKDDLNSISNLDELYFYNIQKQKPRSYSLSKHIIKDKNDNNFKDETKNTTKNHYHSKKSNLEIYALNFAKKYDQSLNLLMN